MVRDVEYLLPASFGIAAMMVYEKQRIEMNQDLIGGFVVTISAQAPDVTYGKSIHTLTQFVFVWTGPRVTRVRISCEVKFGKGGPPGFIASQIANGSRKGGKESAEMLIEMLSSAGSGTGKKKRKKKKKKNWKGLIQIIVLIVVFLGVVGMGFRYFYSEAVTATTEGRDVDELVPKSSSSSGTIESASASAPANTAPANTAPANTAPANTAPANTAPANTAPANTATVTVRSKRNKDSATRTEKQTVKQKVSSVKRKKKTKRNVDSL
jgi:flagellar basal body-associated protein FliL